MTSRERVLEAVAHRPTDRAPANYHAHVEVTQRLIGTLGLADEEALRQFLGIDFRRVSLNYGQPETGPDDEGYVRDVGTYLQRYYIYAVEFIARGAVVGMRARELDTVGPAQETIR